MKLISQKFKAAQQLLEAEVSGGGRGDSKGRSAKNNTFHFFFFTLGRYRKGVYTLYFKNTGSFCLSLEKDRLLKNNKIKQKIQYKTLYQSWKRQAQRKIKDIDMEGFDGKISFRAVCSKISFCLYSLEVDLCVFPI